jgi:cobalamin biosynthetic protein CobC
MKHGGDLTEAIARYGGTPETWLDLSTGINPSPWPASADLLASSPYRLPSRAEESALLSAARSTYRVPAGVDLVAAFGTQALIQWLPYLAAPGVVAIVSPTYNEHAHAWANNGRQVVACASLDHLPQHARHAVIVNPNNPDGTMTPLDAIARAASRLRDRNGWLVVDEAFIDLLPEQTAAGLCAELPIIVLRSFGKFYGLAGVRLGTAIGAPAIIDTIRRALGPWAVSGQALAIGTAALQDDGWADAMRLQLQASAKRLDATLRQAGCAVIGGTALFRLVRHQDAATLHQRLAQRHIWCRSFDWANDLLRFGLPRDERDFTRLADALR